MEFEVNARIWVDIDEIIDLYKNTEGVCDEPTDYWVDEYMRNLASDEDFYFMQVVFDDIVNEINKRLEEEK